MNEKEKKNDFELIPLGEKEALPAEILKSYYDEEEGAHLRDYIEVVLRRKWIVTVFLITMVVTVTLGSFLMSPVFKAQATIQIGKENPNVLTFKDVYQIERQDEDYYQTQYNVLKSKTLAKRVIEKLQLSGKPEFHSLLLKYEDGKDANIQAERENALMDAFLERVDVSPVKRSQLVELSFLSKDPVLAADVANTIANEYIEFTLDNRLNATQQARRWLEKQIEELKGRLETSEEKLNEYVAQSQIIFLNQEKDFESLLTQKLSELSTELGKVTADRIAQEALYNEMEKTGADNNLVLENPLMQSLMKDYSRLESEYDELLKIYKPEYPRMLRLKEQMDSMSKRMKAEARKIVNAVETNYKTAVTREKNLASNIENLRNQVIDFQKKMVQYQILQREVKTNRELYNTLLQRVKEVGVSASMSASNVLVLDRADVPVRPYKPRKTLNIVLSLAIGLFGGVFLAFFVEYLDNTVKTTDEIEKKIHLPVLGMVPVPERQSEHIVSVDPERHDAMSEAFRSIATYIQFSNVSRPPKRILVTSSLEQEGKTTLTVNTAASLVNFMGKGIILDADMRKPRVHTVWGLDNGSGLSSYLSGLTGLDTLVLHTTVPGLDVIPSGPVSPNPSDLLNSSRMKELLDHLEEQYNFVILDSPPVLGMSDSLVLSTLTEGVILVVHAGKTQKEAVLQAKKLLNGVNARILGVVLNGVDFRNRYGYYSYYYSDNGDGKKEKKSGSV